MKTPYLYVEARGWFEDILASSHPLARPLKIPTDDPISFDSVQVRAESDKEAYQLGAAAMDTLRTDDPTRAHHHNTGTFLNDYVVKL